MAEKELTIFLILVNVILLIFIGGIIAFIILYRQRRLQDKKDKELLQQLHQQQLIETQLDIQQQTMRDIGREIHDNVGQKLTLASIYLQSVLHAKQFNEFENQIQDVNKIINDSLRDLRQLSKSLVQPELAQKTLFELLQNEAIQINASGICRLNIVMTPESIVLNTSTKNNLFRLAQEFIQNSIKHARCKNIKLIINQQDDTIHFEFTDDGIGFDMNKAQNTGLGLSNMNRRISELQAIDYEFISIIGKGTTLKFALKTSIHKI